VRSRAVARIRKHEQRIARARYLFLAVRFRPTEDLRDTFAPFFRASLRPMAIACLRLFTLRPEPVLSVPFFRRRMVDFTFFAADLPYFGLFVDLSTAA
jgi:hypothetical protein